MKGLRQYYSQIWIREQTRKK